MLIGVEPETTITPLPISTYHPVSTASQVWSTPPSGDEEPWPFFAELAMYTAKQSTASVLEDTTPRPVIAVPIVTIEKESLETAESKTYTHVPRNIYYPSPASFLHASLYSAGRHDEIDLFEEVPGQLISNPGLARIKTLGTHALNLEKAHDLRSEASLRAACITQADFEFFADPHLPDPVTILKSLTVQGNSKQKTGSGRPDGTLDLLPLNHLSVKFRAALSLAALCCYGDIPETAHDTVSKSDLGELRSYPSMTGVSAGFTAVFSEHIRATQALAATSSLQSWHIQATDPLRPDAVYIWRAADLSAGVSSKSASRATRSTQRGGSHIRILKANFKDCSTALNTNRVVGLRVHKALRVLQSSWVLSMRADSARVLCHTNNIAAVWFDDESVLDSDEERPVALLGVHAAVMLVRLEETSATRNHFGFFLAKSGRLFLMSQSYYDDLISVRERSNMFCVRNVNQSGTANGSFRFRGLLNWCLFVWRTQAIRVRIERALAHCASGGGVLSMTEEPGTRGSPRLDPEAIVNRLFELRTSGNDHPALEAMLLTVCLFPIAALCRLEPMTPLPSCYL